MDIFGARHRLNQVLIIEHLVRGDLTSSSTGGVVGGGGRLVGDGGAATLLCGGRWRVLQRVGRSVGVLADACKPRHLDLLLKLLLSIHQLLQVARSDVVRMEDPLLRPPHMLLVGEDFGGLELLKTLVALV